MTIFCYLASHQRTTTKQDATIQVVSIDEVFICDRSEAKSKLASVNTFFCWVCWDHSQLSSLSLAQCRLAILLYFFIKGGQMLAGFPCIQCNERQQCHTLYDKTASNTWPIHDRGALICLLGGYIQPLANWRANYENTAKKIGGSLASLGIHEYTLYVVMVCVFCSSVGRAWRL